MFHRLASRNRLHDPLLARRKRNMTDWYRLERVEALARL